MPSKHVLVVAEDQLLASFFRSHLEKTGFVVDVAHSGQEALTRAAKRPPDAVVIDSMTPQPEAPEVIRKLRSSPATQKAPIFALPCNRVPLADAALEAGATKVMTRTDNLPHELTDAIQTALGLELTARWIPGVPFRFDASWMQMSLTAAGEAIVAMREGLHGIMRDRQDFASLRALQQRIHGFAEQMSLFGQRPLFLFAAAIEALVFDLVRFPQQINDSTVRTISQALDFLPVITPQESMAQLTDPTTCQVLVIDDEEGAQKIVMAAMNLVGLRSIAAATPSAGLAALRAIPIDLIFLDVGLPEMSGFEVCTSLRSLARHEKTPVIFITGMTTFQNRVQSSLSGGNDFVGKPFNIAELGLKALMWLFKAQLQRV